MAEGAIMEILLKKLFFLAALAAWLLPLFHGEHSAFDGTWEIGRNEIGSQKQPDVFLQGHATAWTYKVSGDEITMTNPAGASYAAKLDGTEARVTNSQSITTVSVKILGTSTLEETHKRGREVIGVLTMKVAADGRAAKASYDDKLQKRTTEFNLIKQ